MLTVSQLEKAGEDAGCIRWFTETQGAGVVVTPEWAALHADRLHWSRLAAHLLSAAQFRRYAAEKELACVLYLCAGEGRVDSKAFNQHVALSFATHHGTR
jgi:hypothetical protein